MDPSEITVVVYQAQGLSTKKKNKHKYNVTFGVNNNRAKSDNVDQADGNPEWNTEAEVKVDNPLDPLVLKVKDKDDILGQITLHMHELPTTKPTRPKKIPLQPHKKAPNPQGELVFCAWISAYGETKTKGQTMGTPNGLAAQKARMLSSGINGSHESLGSTVSGFSTMSESTKKKSALKRFKGVFKKSPTLGGSNLASKNSSQSCMDLSGGQSNLMSIQNINLGGSRESLASQVSEASNLSALSGSAKKKSKNPFKKLKEKTMGPKINKNNSQSLHNLAFGGSSGMSLSPGAHHGSSESLEKLDKSSMDKNFPNKFDLTVPKTLITSPLTGEGDATHKMEEIDESAELTALDHIKGHKRMGSDTSSIHSTGSNKVVTPEPSMQKRRLSYQARSLRDDPRERPHPSKSSPQPSPVSTPVSQRPGNRGSTRSESESASSPSKDDRHHRSLCLPTDESAVHNRSPTMGSSKEDVRTSKSSLNKEKISENTGKLSETSSEDSLKLHPEQGPVLATRQTNPVSSTVKSSTLPISSTLTTKTHAAHHHDTRDTAELPEISGVSPSDCSIEGGTVVTLRGSHLGQDKADVVWLSVCGANCLSSLEYFSAHKLRFTTKAWKPGCGKIVLETQSGGRSRSLVDFTFVDYTKISVDQENDEPLEVAAPVSPKQVKTKPPTSPVKPKRNLQVDKPVEVNVDVKEKPRGHDPESPPSKEEQEVKDPRKQKREDPEGMPTARVESNDSTDKLSSLKKTQSKASPPSKVTESESEDLKNVRSRTASPAPVVEGPSQEELLELVKRLQGENQELKEDNTHMKGYIDRIINKVIDRCPDVLCVDMNAKKA